MDEGAELGFDMEDAVVPGLNLEVEARPAQNSAGKRSGRSSAATTPIASETNGDSSAPRSYRSGTKSLETLDHTDETTPSEVVDDAIARDSGDANEADCEASSSDEDRAALLHLALALAVKEDAMLVRAVSYHPVSTFPSAVCLRPYKG